MGVTPACGQENQNNRSHGRRRKLAVFDTSVKFPSASPAELYPGTKKPDFVGNMSVSTRSFQPCRTRLSLPRRAA